TWLERALDVLGKLPESPSMLEQAVDIRLDLRPVLYQLRDPLRVLTLLLEANDLADKLNDDRRRGRVCAFMTSARTQVGQFDAAYASGTRALAIARELGDLELRILSTTYLGQL